MLWHIVRFYPYFITAFVSIYPYFVTNCGSFCDDLRLIVVRICDSRIILGLYPLGLR